MDADKWSVERVGQWLTDIKLESLVPLFAQNQIDGEVLLTMTENDLKSPPLNITVFGQIRKLGLSIKELSRKCQTSAAVEITSQQDENQPEKSDTTIEEGAVCDASHDEKVESSSFCEIRATCLQSQTGEQEGVKTEETDSVTLCDKILDKPDDNSFTNEFSQRLAETLTLSSETSLVTEPSQADKEKSNLLVQNDHMSKFFSDYCWMYKEDQCRLLDTFLCNAVAESDESFNKLESDDSNKEEHAKTNLESESQKKDTNKEPAANVLSCKGFSAFVSFCVSPVDFYLQPDFWFEEIDRLKEDMTDYYKMNNPTLDNISIYESAYENMPCAALFNEDGQYYRAILTHPGHTDCSVHFVDWGNGQFSEFSSIKPLLKKFGVLPPLALKCRINGVLERTLVQKVLDKFKQEIEVKVLNRVHCVIRKVEAGPVYHVDLFDPETMFDIGAQFLPTDAMVPGFTRLTSKTVGHVNAILCTNGPVGTSSGGDEEDDFDDDVEELDSSDEFMCMQFKPVETPPASTAGQSLFGAAAVEDTAATLSSDTVPPPLDDKTNIEQQSSSSTVPQLKEDEKQSAASVECMKLASQVAITFGRLADVGRPPTSSATPSSPATARSTTGDDNDDSAAFAPSDSFVYQPLKHSAAMIKPEEYKRKLEEAAAKEEKLRRGGYSNDLEAFLDGAPVADDYDSFVDSSEEENVRRKTTNRKKKRLKQLKRELESKR